MSKENGYFFLILGITVVVFFTIWTIGEKKKAIYSAQYSMYADAAVKVETNPKEAITLLNTLEKEAQTNYLFPLKKGISYISLKNYEKASIEFKKALHIRPLLVTDSDFLLQYADATIHTGERKLAKELLKRASKMELSDELEKRYKKLKKEIQHDSKD